jgi:hypothetical protein
MTLKGKGLNPTFKLPQRRARPSPSSPALANCPCARKYGFMDKQMKTTVEMPEELYRRAKALAALQGRKLKDLIEEGLRLVVESPRKRRPPATLADLTRSVRGVVDSGIPDLASNPQHLAGFGRDARRHR